MGRSQTSAATLLAKASLCESVSCGILALLVGGGGGGGAGLAFASECASGAL